MKSWVFLHFVWRLKSEGDRLRRAGHARAEVLMFLLIEENLLGRLEVMLSGVPKYKSTCRPRSEPALEIVRSNKQRALLVSCIAHTTIHHN